MTLTEEELRAMRAPRPKPTPLEAAQREIERLRTALRYYRNADFLTTEQQQVAEAALSSPNKV